MAAALLDRLLHHCNIVNIHSNGYRMRRHAHLSKAIHPGTACDVSPPGANDSRTPLDPSPLSDIFKAHKVGHFPCRLTHTAQVVRAWPPTRGYRPAFNNVDKWWYVPCTQWDWRGDAAPPF